MVIRRADWTGRVGEGKEEGRGLVAWEVTGWRSKSDGRKGVGRLGQGESVYVSGVEQFQLFPHPWHVFSFWFVFFFF